MPYYYLASAKIPTRDAPAGRPIWARAWVPAGCDPQSVDWRGRRWIWLSRFTDHALVVLRDPSSDPSLTLLASSPDERVAGSTRTVLQNLLNDRSLGPQATFKDTIASIFLNPPSDERWGRPLRPNRRLGLYRVDLQLVDDPTFWEQPGPFRTRSTVTLTDNFNRTANLGGSTASGGGTWAILDSPTPNDVDTNGTACVIPSGHGFATAWITTNHDTDDHSCQIDMVTIAASNSAVGVGVRIQGASGQQGYGLEVTNGGSARLYRWDTDANLDTGTVTLSLPDTLYLQFDGSAYDCRFNGTTISGMSGTDTLFTGHLRTAISLFSSSGVAAIDNFSATDISVGVAITPPVGAVVLTGLAPSLYLGVYQPAAGALSLAGLAPTASVASPFVNDAKIIIRAS